MQSVYIIDTNVLRVWLNYYLLPGIPAFDRFWSKLEEMIKTSKIILVREVYRELELQVRQEDGLNWLRQHKQFFLEPTNEETEFLVELFSHKKFQESVRPNNIKGNRPSADPFIIAKAKSLGENGIVITREST